MAVAPQALTTLQHPANPLPWEPTIEPDNQTFHLTGARRSMLVSDAANDTKDITLPGQSASTFCRGIYVFTTGNIVLALADDDPTLANVGLSGGPQTVPVVAGQLLPFVCRRILATGTTATGILLF